MVSFHKGTQLRLECYFPIHCIKYLCRSWNLSTGRCLKKSVLHAPPFVHQLGQRSKPAARFTHPGMVWLTSMPLTLFLSTVTHTILALSHFFIEPNRTNNSSLCHCCYLIKCVHGRDVCTGLSEGTWKVCFIYS